MMRRKRKVNKVILFGTGIMFMLLGGLTVNRCEAQEMFGYRVDLDTVKQAGFYKVTLQPDLVAKCREDLSDLRIRNKEGKFVPYVLKSDLPVFATKNFTNGKYLGVAYPAITQKDSSNKHSYITLQYRDRYRIDKLDLIIQRPGLYKRRAWIYDNTNGVAGRNPVAEITISPVGTSFAVSPVKTNSLLLDIANEDAAPLVIQAVKTAQLNQYLLTYLQPGDSYCLLGGNEHATAPAYDLKYFTDSLTTDPQELLSGPLKPESSNKGPVAPATKDPSRAFLWVVLGLVLVVLAFLSFKMIQSISEKDTHDRV